MKILGIIMIALPFVVLLRAIYRIEGGGWKGVAIACFIVSGIILMYVWFASALHFYNLH